MVDVKIGTLIFSVLDTIGVPDSKEKVGGATVIGDILAVEQLIIVTVNEFGELIGIVYVDVAHVSLLTTLHTTSNVITWGLSNLIVNSPWFAFFLYVVVPEIAKILLKQTIGDP